MKTLVYVFGPPAAGKSTLMAHLTAACARTPQPDKTPPHDALTPPQGAPGSVAELGRRRPNSPGTDTLSMSINPAACTALGPEGDLHPYPLLLGEGDRLANFSFFSAARAHNRTVRPVLLVAPPAVTDERCARRGSTQSLTWRRSRTTRAERLAAHLDAAGVCVTTLDATHPTPDLAAELHERIPELEVLA